MVYMMWKTFGICCLFVLSMGDTGSPPCQNDKDPLQALQDLNVMTTVIQSCQQLLNGLQNESKLEVLAQNIKEIEQKLKVKDQEIEQIKGEFQQLKKECDGELKSRISNLDEKVSNIENNVNSTLQAIRTEQIDNITEQDLRISLFETDMRNVMERIAKMEDDMTKPVVSFSAYKTKIMNDSQIGVPVVFEGVRDNYGNAYNTSTGIFTAPVNGTYYFYVTILSLNTPAEYGIYKESTVILHILADRSSGYDEASGSVVVHLDKGNNVSVKPFFRRGHGLNVEFRTQRRIQLFSQNIYNEGGDLQPELVAVPTTKRQNTRSEKDNTEKTNTARDLKETHDIETLNTKDYT